jgi:hypothetical protein
MRFPRVTALGLIAIAACTQSPTASTAKLVPAFDGLGLGSGHVVTPSDSIQNVAASTETATTSDSVGIELGGLGLGSGH